MRRGLALTLVLCMALTLVSTAAAAGTSLTGAEAAEAALNAGSDFYYELVEKYSDSADEYNTEVRWWIAEGTHTDETLLEEIQAMYDAGFRGVEICQLDMPGVDASQWAYGSDQWNHDFNIIMNKALDLGMNVGITSGTHWQTTNIPGLDPDTQQAMQCVFQLNESFAAGTELKDHQIPTSQTTSSCLGTTTTAVREVNQWIGSYAYEILDDTSSPVIVGDIVDLSEYVSVQEDGSMLLNWTVPNDATYHVYYYWMQATAQQSDPSVEPAYCVNYYDIRGFEAWKSFFEKSMLSDEALNAKILEGEVQLFMDSLEFNYGDGFLFWAEDFAEEFEARKGYDVTPYLFLAVGLTDSLGQVEPAPIPYGTYNLPDANAGQKILNDIFDVETELYMERLLQPMEAWLNEYGIDLRAQMPYCKYLEISEPSLAVDYPEAENLNQHNQVDIYRLWTGGAKLENKILSSETGAAFSMTYGYDHQQHLQEAYSLYAAGFSRVNWHVWSSQWAPEGSWSGGTGSMGMPTGVTWPGYNSLSLCHPLGVREPNYENFVQFNEHLSRVQQLMREGKARTDVGMIYQKYGQGVPTSATKETDMWMQRHDYMLFPSTELQENGYTYDYFSPDFLNSENVYYDAENGTLELAGYKALVLWQEWLSLDGAQSILDMAREGLKVVIVDGAAGMSPYQEDDEALSAVMTELKTLPNVAAAASADDVMETLQSLGVEPYAGFETEQLLSQVRQDGENLYLYLYNYCDGSLHDGDDEDHGLVADEDIVVDGTFIPYCIDSWSGEVVQVSDYHWKDGKTIIHVELDYGDIALFAFEAAETEPEHVISSDADTYVTEDGIVLRAIESGTYTTKLAYGRTVNTTVEVPASYDITGWTLDVEVWEDSGEFIYREQTVDGVLNKEQTYATRKTNVEGIKLDKLTTWDNIPELGKGISGKGSYAAVFHWDGVADGAYLNFGTDLVDGMTVYINGQETDDVNMNVPVVDISDLLVVGENTITIDYNSNLTNELLETGVINEKVADYTGMFFIYNLWGGYDIQYRSYGPMQAVVVPYVEETIEILGNNDVTVNVVGAAEAVINTETSFDITVSGAEALATATLTIETGGLTDVAVTPAEGWMVYNQTEENNVITLVMGNLTGVNGDDVIATVTGGVMKIGVASVVLTDVVLSAYVDNSETFVNVILETDTVETAVKYSTYDVNQDGTVNQLDITRAQRFYGSADALADVNDDGEVNIDDLILILNNYSK